MRRYPYWMSAISLVVILLAAWFVNKYFSIEAHALASRIWSPPTVQQQEIHKLRKIAGWFSVNCGHVFRRESGDDAIACAMAALKTGKPFCVSFDYRGIDSHGTTGLAANAKRELYSVTTDEMGGGVYGYVVGSAGRRDVSILRCAGGPVEQTYAF